MISIRSLLLFANQSILKMIRLPKVGTLFMVVPSSIKSKETKVGLTWPASLRSQSLRLVPTCVRSRYDFDRVSNLTSI